ncbi:hypothetical protein EDF67_101445 [Sphingobacterium sp. JUb78]|jgi:hypothetical protein|nr:hypothetical protein [Sphingobacterium kitahiroshimense]TCR14341.1 hypothetical protein EDF67_101445 [Sphingobacterium sp. JUb78]
MAVYKFYFQKQCETTQETNLSKSVSVQATMLFDHIILFGRY